MQLVPILSTIILVGTIATFILAVAAYILYKIRERRAREEGVVQTQYVQEPHVLVAPQQSTLIAPAQQAQQPAPSTNVYVAPAQNAPVQQQAAVGRPAVVQQRQPQQQQAGDPQNSLFWEYTDEGFMPVQPDNAGQQKQQDEEEKDEGFAWL